MFLYYFAAFFCFCFAIVVDWILDPDDWVPIVKVSYAVVVIFGFVFAAIAIFTSIFN